MQQQAGGDQAEEEAEQVRGADAAATEAGKQDEPEEVSDEEKLAAILERAPAGFAAAFKKFVKLRDEREAQTLAAATAHFDELERDSKAARLAAPDESGKPTMPDGGDIDCKNQ